MTNYMIAYYGGNQPSSKEEGIAQMGKWKAWIESLSDAVACCSNRYSCSCGCLNKFSA